MVNPIKSLGQHFLVSREVAHFMADAAKLTKDDVVLEIGPGKGMISKYLARKAGKLYYIEKDPRMERQLSYVLGNVEPIWGDALQTPWPQDANKLVSNLPFNIAAQVIFRIPETMELAVLGVQEEFGKKMAAKPGDSNYGRLSVSSQMLFKVDYLKTYPPSVFKPRPQVSLGVVRLTPKKRPADWARLEKFIKDIFNYPNKTINNSLKLGGYNIKTRMRRKVRNMSGKHVLKLFKRLRKSA